MSLAPLAITAAGYVLKALGKSKKVNEAKDDIVQAFDNEVSGLWAWMKPFLIKEEENKLVSKVEEAPGEEKTKNILEFKLEEKLENDSEFKAVLEEKVEKIREIEKQILNITNISNAGIVSLGGNVNIEGKNVAGHDMTININKGDDD